MTTMLEKAARAAEEADMDWAFNPDGDRFEQVARAVLLAIREPEVEMTDEIMQNFADPCWPQDAKLGFTAMIDAILAGETET